MIYSLSHTCDLWSNPPHLGLLLGHDTSQPVFIHIYKSSLTVRAERCRLHAKNRFDVSCLMHANPWDALKLCDSACVWALRVKADQWNVILWATKSREEKEKVPLAVTQVQIKPADPPFTLFLFLLYSRLDDLCQSSMFKSTVLIQIPIYRWLFTK